MLLRASCVRGYAEKTGVRRLSTEVSERLAMGVSFRSQV